MHERSVRDIGKRRPQGVVGARKTKTLVFALLANILLLSGANADEPFGSAGAGCVDYTDYIRFAGSVFTSDALDVIADGDIAYVAGWAGGLHVVDGSDPTSPIRLGGCNGSFTKIALWNQSILAIDANGDLRIIDVSKPTSPQVVHSLITPGFTQDLVVVGNTAFLADDEAGLQIVQITGPQNLSIVGSLDTPGRTLGVDAIGNFAYIADGDGGFFVVDVSYAEIPEIVGSAITPGPARGVSVSGSHAYCIGGFQSIQVLDVVDPSHPQAVSSVPTLTFPLGVAVHKERVIACLGNEGFEIFDVQDPRNPLLVGQMASHGVAHAVDVSRSTMFVADGNTGLSTFEFSKLQQVPMLARLDIPSSIHAMAQSGSYLYATSYSTLRVLDVTDPRQPRIVGSTGLPSGASPLAIAGSHAYVGSDYNGLRVIDIQDATNPHEIGFLDLYGDVEDVAVAGDYAYFAQNPSLRVISIASPAFPQLVASIYTTSSLQGVAVSGRYLYGNGYSGLYVFDIQDPSFPSLVTTFDATPPGANNYPNDVLVREPFAYLASGSFLHVIDISNPSSPTLVRTLTLRGGCVDIAKVGDFIYLAAGQGGVHVIDVRDPYDPKFLASSGLLGFGYCIAASKTHVFGMRWYFPKTTLYVLPLQCSNTGPFSERVEVNADDVLLALFPNPATDHATIRLRQETSGTAHTSIYDLGGRLVRRLRNTDGSSANEWTWDARDESGTRVAAGVYMIRATTLDGEATQRLTMLR